eukprot:SAG11_NODE_12124_length_720_cov_2.969404_1_plen_56_part_10
MLEAQPARIAEIVAHAQTFAIGKARGMRARQAERLHQAVTNDLASQIMHEAAARRS